MTIQPLDRGLRPPPESPKVWVLGVAGIVAGQGEADVDVAAGGGGEDEDGGRLSWRVEFPGDAIAG